MPHVRPGFDLPRTTVTAVQDATRDRRRKTQYRFQNKNAPAVDGSVSSGHCLRDTRRVHNTFSASSKSRFSAHGNIRSPGTRQGVRDVFRRSFGRANPVRSYSEYGTATTHGTVTDNDHTSCAYSCARVRFTSEYASDRPKCSSEQVDSVAVSTSISSAAPLVGAAVFTSQRRSSSL